LKIDTKTRVLNEAARLERVIARGQADGTIRSGFDAPFLAGQIIAVLEGGVMLSRLSKKPEPLHDSILFLRQILFTNPPAGKE
jgi:TetR/AcrR family transcriptional repressor of nem operon